MNIFVIYKLKKDYKLISEFCYLIEQLQNKVSAKQQIIEEKDNMEALELVNLDSNNRIDSILKVEKKLKQSLLVCRFSSNGCQSCIDSLLVLIKTVSDTLKSNILIVSDNKTKNELYVRLHYAGLDQIRYTVSEKLSFPFDSHLTPYFFIIDNNMTVRMFFIPDRENKKRTLGYLKYILKKYFLSSDFKLKRETFFP